MFPVRREREKIVPSAGMSKEGIFAANHLEIELAKRKFVPGVGLQIPKSVIEEILSGIGYLPDEALDRAIPLLLKHFIRNMDITYNSENSESPFYLLTEPHKKS